MNSYASDRTAVLEGKQTVSDISKNYRNHIAEKSSMNIFLALNDNLHSEALESDSRFNSNNPLPLDGLHIAIKDNISTKDLETTCASKMLQGFIPVYNATVIDRLKNQGALIVGKTNMDEFAMGSSGETSYFGFTHHPVHSGYVPGGSSSGSAVAVAAKLCHASLGSDTGGSVRQPAAFCGVYGFKPSYGRISRYGLVAFASSLDQIGIFSRDIDTMASVFDAISGKDDLDSTSSHLPSTNSVVTIADEVDFTKLTFAILPDSELQGISPEIKNAYNNTINVLKNLGVTFIVKEIPGSSAWIPTYYILATAEASSNLARYDGVRYGHRSNSTTSLDSTTISRSEGFGKEVKRRIMLGTYVLSSGYYDAYYIKAQKARRLISDGYSSIFKDAHAFLLPTTPGLPFKMGEKSDPLEMYLSDYFTVSANIAGIPAISFPAGTTESGFSIGMQLQTAFNNDELLLALTKAISAKMT